MNIKYLLLALLPAALLLSACENTAPSATAVDPEPLNKELLPPEAEEINGGVFTLNSWQEKGRFIVTGICSSSSEKWQKIWVELRFLDEAGNPVPVMGHATAILATFADAVPPYGRTSFMGFWALAGFGKKQPKSCEVVSIKGTAQQEGAILVATNVSSLKMGVNENTPNGPAMRELAWQLTGELQNPLEVVASKPKIEVMVWGNDDKLWYCTLLDLATPEAQAVFNYIEKEGPLQPKESRFFNLRVFYDRLPQAVNDGQIGRIDLQPFEGR